MKALLGKLGGNGGRLHPVKLNPNPSADYLRQFKQARRLVKEQIQHFIDGQTTVGKPCLKINPLQLCFLSARLCGPVLEP
jgi:hypothetical protein